MPGLGPYNPEAEPRKESRRTRRLGWGKREFQHCKHVEDKWENNPGGMFNGACGGLLRKNQKKKKRETLTKERKEERSSSVAECCGRGLRVAASLGSTKSSSSPRCAGEAGHGGKQSAHLGFPCR